MDSTLDSKLVAKPVEAGKLKKRVRWPSRLLPSSSYGLVSYKELPEYMKDNEFIVNYYRANWPLKEALFSIFRWHNETLRSRLASPQAYSDQKYGLELQHLQMHLFGFLLFLGLTMANLIEVPQVLDLIAFITRSSPVSGNVNVSQDLVLKPITASESDITLTVTPVTRWPFYVLLAGSMFCLLSSSLCHLFSCHSHRLNIMLMRMDYTGIAIMIIATFFPPVYYSFPCDPQWQFIYLGGITVLGLFTIVTLLSPAMSTNKFRPFRALLFASMGLFGIVPGTHAAIANWSNPRRSIALAYEFATSLFYITGVVFYVSRVPERFKPGWFDLACHSHQIFHVMVVMGALAHYGASLVFLDWRNHESC
ncbi:hypothetical protein ES288_A13G236100v1 [Gossypium darwinii]|uniref:Heptahelical transmembrane protein 1-like n=1 Tax=Gossypium darwinii TaxID=34276 RepID=A0A5D2E2K0_GOSDA|nr:hypothetical protein ES288_A13G236100v1 [Gossypium darwinii]